VLVANTKTLPERLLERPGPTRYGTFRRWGTGRGPSGRWGVLACLLWLAGTPLAGPILALVGSARLSGSRLEDGLRCSCGFHSSSSAS
jgi:hypothetical protein